MSPPIAQESFARKTAPEAVVGSEPATSAVDISVIVLVTHPASRLEDLYHEYAAAIRELGRPFEFLFAIEPWVSSLAEPLHALVEDGEPIRIIEFARSVGEASLLRLAGERSRGRIVVTLPAYYRVEAEALPDLVAQVEEGCDMAVARRWPRNDRLINRLQSRAFNSMLHVMIGQTTQDVACGVQAMRREVLDETPLYGDFFRFLPVLAAREGFSVTEVDAPQHPRDLRTRVYSPGIYFRRLIDILGLFFLVRFTEKPLRFFGLVGSSLAVSGTLVLAVLLVQRQFGGQPMANRPMLLVGVTALTLGVQAIALGLIGEIIVHLNAGRERHYRVLDDAPDE
jgi:hypothetical protein